MPTVDRVRTALTGWPGGPGVATMYFTSHDGSNSSALQAFWTAVKGFMPTGITIKVDDVGAKIDVGTGQPVGNWSVSGGASQTTSGSGGYAGPCGAVVHWRTGSFAGGREIKGKTFLVPLSGGAYDGDGTLTAATKTGLQNAATTFVTASADLAVWSKRNALSATVGSAQVADLAAVLRSRRD